MTRVWPWLDRHDPTRWRESPPRCPHSDTWRCTQSSSLPRCSRRAAYYIVVYPVTSFAVPGTSDKFEGDLAVGIDALSIKKVGYFPATPWQARMGG